MKKISGLTNRVGGCLGVSNWVTNDEDGPVVGRDGDEIGNWAQLITFGGRSSAE